MNLYYQAKTYQNWEELKSPLLGYLYSSFYQRSSKLFILCFLLCSIIFLVQQLYFSACSFFILFLMLSFSYHSIIKRHVSDLLFTKGTFINYNPIISFHTEGICSGKGTPVPYTGIVRLIAGPDFFLLIYKNRRFKLLIGVFPRIANNSVFPQSLHGF